MSGCTTRKGPWPDDVLREIDELERKHGIELVSADYAAELHRRIEEQRDAMFFAASWLEKGLPQDGLARGLREAAARFS